MHVSRVGGRSGQRTVIINRSRPLDFGRRLLNVTKTHNLCLDGEEKEKKERYDESQITSKYKDEP